MEWVAAPSGFSHNNCRWLFFPLVNVCVVVEIQYGQMANGRCGVDLLKCIWLVTVPKGRFSPINPKHSLRLYQHLWNQQKNISTSIFMQHTKTSSSITLISPITLHWPQLGLYYHKKCWSWQNHTYAITTNVPCICPFLLFDTDNSRDRQGCHSHR